MRFRFPVEKTEILLAVYRSVCVALRFRVEKNTRFLKRTIFLQSAVQTSIYGSTDRKLGKKCRCFEKTVLTPVS